MAPLMITLPSTGRVIWGCSRFLPVLLHTLEAFLKKLGPAVRVNRIFLGGEFGSQLCFLHRTPSTPPMPWLSCRQEEGWHTLFKTKFCERKGLLVCRIAADLA